MGQISLVLGGIRSGKSQFAETLAMKHASVAYIATAQAGDVEMVERIRVHQERRPDHWETIDCPWELSRTIQELAASEPECMVVECLSMWVSNLLTGGEGREPIDASSAVGEWQALKTTLEESSLRFVIVSAETGLGLVPPDELTRSYVDILGRINQELAEMAEEVYFCIAGRQLKI